MKRLLLAALAALTLAAPASAQYYGSPYSSPYEEQWQPAPRNDYDRPSYGYRPRQDYEERDYDRYERRVYRYERPWRRQVQQFGNVCVTSRGSCEYPQSFPLNSRCRCDIPGFGLKRGFIQY